MSNKNYRKGTVMKKLYTTLMMAMMAMMTLSLTSCEIDEEIAYDLEGTWKGNMHIIDDYGEETTYSELTFIRYSNTSTEGMGLWDDYYEDGYCVSTRFTWFVDWSDIIIDFEDGVRVEIRDYRLTSGHFSGRFWDSYNEVAFDLISTARKYSGGYYRTRGETDATANELHPTHHRIK